MKASSRTESATSGMIWVSISVLATKLLLFFMQFVLGFVLNPRDYSVFAVVSVALAFVSGLQSAGVGKMLVRRPAQYASLVQDYTNFALYMGLIAALVLIVLGFAFGKFYRNSDIAFVVGLSALAVPFTSVNTVQFARLSMALRFRTMCIVDFCVMGANVFTVLIAAHLGATYYSIGLGLVASTLLRFIINRQLTDAPLPKFGLPINKFIGIFGDVKWIILMAFLTGVAQQGDYFVLGRLVSPEALGNYYFGFQLTANIGQLLAQGISSTLFPIFTSLRDNTEAFYRAFLRSSSVIHFVCSILALIIVGFAPWLVHAVWRGKWDAATITAVAMAFSLPMRMLSPMAAATFDAVGKFRLRTSLLVFDSSSMLLAALAGAYLGDLKGASIAVAIQRLVSSMVDFSNAARVLGGKFGDFVRFAVRSFVPFWLPAGGLVAANVTHPLLHNDVSSALSVALRTAAAIGFFALFVFYADRQIIAEVLRLLRNIVTRTTVAENYRRGPIL